MIQRLIPTLGLLLAMNPLSSSAATLEEAEKLHKDGNYAESLEQVRELAHTAETSPKVAARALELGVDQLQKLNRVAELDAFIEGAVTAHTGEFPVAVEAAEAWVSIPHHGDVQDGTFQRRSYWASQSSVERDRVRALQLLRGVLDELEEQSSEAQGKALEALANALHQGESWRLLALTDLETVPEVNEGRWRDQTNAPVDESGRPIFHQLPESFEAATTDGERWMWAIRERRKLGGQQAAESRMMEVSFLRSQFEVQTMRQATWSSDDNAEAERLGRLLRTLKDSETIAWLANGPQRFDLPADQNHLTLLRQIADSELAEDGIRRQAMGDLARIFVSRDQRPKAARSLERLIEMPVENENSSKWAVDLLDQIIGKHGTLDGMETEAPGEAITVGYRFRNAERVALSARRVDFRQLLADVRLYLESNPEEVDWGMLQISNLSRDLLDGDRARYLGEEVAAWAQDLEPALNHLDKRVLIQTPLKDPGVYWLEADVEHGDSSYVLVWVTDTAIVRKPLDKNFHYYIADARTGSPISGARVEFFGWQQKQKLLNRDEQRVVTNQANRTSSPDGEVRFMGDRDKQWLVTATTEEGRFAHLGFDRLWTYSYDDSLLDEVRVFPITDRPVYRPGDEVKFKAWVARTSYGETRRKEFEGVTVDVKIHDAKGEKVLEERMTADAFGGISGSFELGDDASLGNYSIRIEAAKDFNGYRQFRVEEYKKPEFEVLVEAPDEPVSLGETFKSTVKANYYFGAPVTNGEAQIKVKRKASSTRFFPPRPWDWLYGRGYAFYQPEHTWYPGWRMWGCISPPLPWGNQVSSQEELIMDETLPLGPDGTVEITIDTALALELHGDTDHHYNIEVEITDESRRTINGSGSVIAARQPFEVFVTLDRGYYQQGDTLTVSGYARTPDGTPVTSDEASIILYRIDYNDEGEPKETAVHTFETATDSDGRVEHTLRLPDAGQFRAVVQVSAQGGKSSDGGRIFLVRSADFDGRDYRFNALELIPDQDTYAPGDRLRLMINTEQENSTVVLFVNPVNGIYKDPMILRLAGKSMVQEFFIEDADQPNVFLEGYTISNGEVHQVTRQIIVPPESRALNMELTTTEQNYLPGAEVDIGVKLTDAAGNPVEAQTALTVYDKSLEYISGGTNIPGIQSTFWGWKRHHYPAGTDNLSARYGSVGGSLESLGLGWGYDPFASLSDGNKMVVTAPVMEMAPRSGGLFNRRGAALQLDAAESAVMADGFAEVSSVEESSTPATPEVVPRTLFADSIFWMEALQTNAQGRAVASFTVPDNLTTWSLRGWGLGDGARVGEGNSEFITKKNLILRQQAPRFFVEKDEVVLSANVHSYLDEEQAVTVSLVLDGEYLQPMTETLEQTLILQPGEEQRVDWRVKAIAEGESRVRMIARSELESDGVEIAYPVLVHGMLKTESWSGVISRDQDRAAITINVPEDRRPEQSLLQVRYSPSIAAAMVDALPYLIEYPYGCTEQTVNRFVPSVITRKVLDNAGIRLADIRNKANNLNPQQLGDAAERAAQWKQGVDDSPVFNEAKLNRLIRTGVEKLESTQNSDGGWGWFTDSSSAHTTAVVVQALQQGLAADLEMDRSIYERGLRWLANHEKERVSKIIEKREDGWKAGHMDAMVAAILATEQAGDARMLDLLYEDRTDLSIYAKSLLGMALHHTGRNNEMGMVIRNIEQFLVRDEENQTAWLNLGNGGYWWHWWGNDIETHAAYLKLLVTVNPRAAHAPGIVKYLLNNRTHGTWWNSTRDTALCVEAIAEYFRVSGESTPDQTIRILMDGELRKTIRIRPDDLFHYDHSFDLGAEDLASGEHTIEFVREGEGPLYFNAYLTNFTKEDQITAAGLEVKVDRTYWKLTPKDQTEFAPGARGQAIEQNKEAWTRTRIDEETELQSGDLVEVELILESKNDYDYILVEDPKPAGMEPVDVRSGYFGGAYRELRDEKVALFFRNLNQGTRTITYRVRAEIPGKFSALPTRIEGMYAPELRGNSDEDKLTIED